MSLCINTVITKKMPKMTLALFGFLITEWNSSL